VTRHAGIVAAGRKRPTFVAKGSAIATQGAAVVSYPAGIQAGDLLVILSQTDQGDSVTTPAGWTEEVDESSTECRFRVFWKYHTSGSSATISWSGDHIVARCFAFRDVHPSSPINASRDDNNTSLGTVVLIPGVTSTVNNCLILAMVAHDIASNSSQVSGWANANLEDASELDDTCSTVGWDGGFAMYAGYKVAASAVGNTTATLGTAKKRAYGCIALAPP
jgi:hypothetical protein